MRLKEVKVSFYRNIVNSNIISIDKEVTCLVGKNESGKTAILQALYNLNPAYADSKKANITSDYPRWRKVRDGKKMDLESVTLIEVVFSLEESDIQVISESIPLPIPNGTEIEAGRNYAGDLTIKLKADEVRWVQELISSCEIDDTLEEKASECRTLTELEEFCKTEYQKQEDKRKAIAKKIQELGNDAKKALMHSSSIPTDVSKEIEQLLPKFFYFSEYSSLPGRLDLNKLGGKTQGFSDSERTAISLLKLAGVHGEELMEENFEVRIAELEAAANEITSQVFEYWTQNKDLIVQLVSDTEIINHNNRSSVTHKYVDLRLNDLRHQMTTNFETRSTGFQWFFSFIAAFSEFSEDESLVILLDEPGLGLHARAQRDLLRFIDERLGENHQVIYTTHSPFMVDPTKLERVRLVEDLTTRENPDRGAQVSDNVLSVHGDTLFPLQAALGYNLAQNLFVGGFNLIVEGPSDMIFLLTMSEYLETNGRIPLDNRFTLVPVGGIDKIPTFIALLGARLDITVLVDGTSAPHHRIQDMIKQKILTSEKLISVDEVTEKPHSDVEDLFSESEYLNLYNRAFDSDVKPSDLHGNDSIIRKLERYGDGKFKHLKPATVFLRTKEAVLENLSDETLDKFEKLFSMLNATIA